MNLWIRDFKDLHIPFYTKSFLSTFKIIIRMKNSPGGNPTMQNESVFSYRLKFSFSMLTLVFLFFTSCELDDIRPELDIALPDLELSSRSWQSPDMVLTWNQAIEDMYTFPTNAQSKSQPVVARIMAMYHLAIHDALNCITPRYERYVGVPRDKDADPDAAVAQAAYDVIAVVKYPDQSLAPMTALLQTSLASIPEGDAKTRGIALGHAVAAAILAQRAVDVPLIQGNYGPPPPEGDEPGEFRYIPPLNYGLNGYHLMTPFVIESQDQFRPGPPYVVYTPEYTTDYNEVKTLGRATGSARTAEQTEIAVFWAEITNRKWNDIAQQVIASRPPHSMDAWKTARLLALMHAAIADANINSFDSKMYYYHWAPISSIRLGDSDGNDDTAGDALWTALIPALPIGGYPGVHSEAGAAAGEVLIRFFNKDDYDLDLNSPFLPGVIRQFDSISDAVDECTIAKIYTGHNTRHAVDAGEEMGYLVGDYVFENGLQ